MNLTDVTVQNFKKFEKTKIKSIFVMPLYGDVITGFAPNALGFHIFSFDLILIKITFQIIITLTNHRVLKKKKNTHKTNTYF